MHASDTHIQSIHEILAFQISLLELKICCFFFLILCFIAQSYQISGMCVYNFTFVGVMNNE